MNDVLKPKSKEELSKFIESVPLYYFLYKFKTYDISDLKISFKKRFFHFLIRGFSQSKFIFVAIHLILLILWISIGILSSKVTIPNIFFIIKYVAMTYCIVFLFVQYTAILINHNTERFMRKKKQEYLTASNIYINTVLSQTTVNDFYTINFGDLMSFEQFIIDKKSYEKIILRYR